MDIKKTDPEFAERFERFAYCEVVNEDGRTLEAPVRYPAILEAQSVIFGDRMREAWKNGHMGRWLTTVSATITPTPDSI